MALNVPPPTRVAVGYVTVNGQRLEMFLNPEWARYFNALNAQVVTTTSAVGLPGAPGATGAAGSSVSFSSGDSDASVEFIPGPQGVAGPMGPAGPMLFIDAEQTMEFVPGPAGPTGATGSQGPVGANGAIVSLMDSQDTVVEFIPGPTGAVGPCGPAGPALALMMEVDQPTEMPMGSPTASSVNYTGGITSSGLVGIGYTVGAGGTVTQATSKATGVTLNTPTGQITMNAASLGASTTVSFTLTNSVIAATDTLDVHRKSGGTAVAYNVWVDSIAAGSAVIAVRNLTAGALLEAVVLQFTVQKGSNT